MNVSPKNEARCLMTGYPLSFLQKGAHSDKQKNHSILKVPADTTYFPALAVIKLHKEMPVLGNFLQIRYDTYFHSDSICTEGAAYSHGLMDLKYKWIKMFTPIIMEAKSSNFCSDILNRKSKEHMEKYKDMICMARGNSDSKTFAPAKCDSSTEVNDIKEVKYSFNHRMEAQNDF